MKQQISRSAYLERYQDQKEEKDLDDLDLIDYTIIHERPDWFWWLMEQGDFVNKKYGKFYTKYRSRFDTALTYAVSHNLVDISRHLWEHGARVRYYLHDSLLLAIERNKHDMAELLFGMGARIQYKYKFRDCLKMADDWMKQIISNHLDACPPDSVVE